MNSENVTVLYQNTVKDTATLMQAAEQQVAFTCMDLRALADAALRNPELFKDVRSDVEEIFMLSIELFKMLKGANRWN